MFRHPPRPACQAPPPSVSRRKRNRLVSLAYVLGLLLVFALSLLLLPADTGLGKLLWGAL